MAPLRTAWKSGPSLSRLQIIPDRGPGLGLERRKPVPRDPSPARKELRLGRAWLGWLGNAQWADRHHGPLIGRLKVTLESLLVPQRHFREVLIAHKAER